MAVPPNCTRRAQIARGARASEGTAMTDHNAAQYRSELARILRHADAAQDPAVRRTLMEIARQYERLAAWTQRRQNEKTSKR